MKSILYQGAESIIYLKKKEIIKDRIKKSYRHPFLDSKIRKQRTNKEIKLLKKSSEIINVPKIKESNGFKINLEYIKGKKISNYLEKMRNKNEIFIKIGESIARLHDKNIIHGDLTTSNMILKDNHIYIIDFGLGFESNRIEDKATDLRLIKQALDAKHFKFSKILFENFLKGYKESKNFSETVNKLKVVESRGRYKSQF